MVSLHTCVYRTLEQNAPYCTKVEAKRTLMQDFLSSSTVFSFILFVSQ